MKSIIASYRSKQGQQGLSLLEILIAMVIGLFILGAVLGLFVSMIKSDSDNIKAIQLNQELRNVMGLMTRDIRRAGSNRNAAVNATTTPPTNPFSVAGTTRLTIGSNPQGTANACVIYSYDSNEASELYGFRLDEANHTIEARVSGSTCSAAGWTDLTDSTYISISGLTFADTTVTVAGINLRQINITLTGNLENDPTVVRTLSETVKLRNDEF